MERAARVITLSLFAVGLLALGALVFELTGTEVQASRGQDRLERAYQEAAARPNGGVAAVWGEESSGHRQATSVSSLDSYPIRIEIPDVDLASYIGPSATDAALRHGPGHVAATALPGDRGTAVIAGNCRSYGATFSRLGELEPGDDLYVTRPGAPRRHYRITTVRSTNVDAVITMLNRQVVAAGGSPVAISLVTCRSRWSSDGRIIATAVAAESPGGSAESYGLSGVGTRHQASRAAASGQWTEEPWAPAGWLAEPLALLHILGWLTVAGSLALGAVRALANSAGVVERSCIVAASSAPLVISLYMLYVNIYRVMPSAGACSLW